MLGSNFPVAIHNARQGRFLAAGEVPMANVYQGSLVGGLMTQILAVSFLFLGKIPDN